MGKPDLVEKEIQKIVLLTGERLRSRANGPSADLLSALSKLTNSLVKIRLQRTGGATQSPKGRTEAEIIEDIELNGIPGAYEKMCREC